MTMTIITFTLFIGIVSISVNGQSGPMDIAERTGNDVLLPCQLQDANDGLEWKYLGATGGTTDTTIYFRMNGQVTTDNTGTHYEIVPGPGTKYNLKIKNIQLDDFGKYECRVYPTGSPPVNFNAEVTVIDDSSFRCPNNNGIQQSQDIGTLNCEATVRSNKQVQLEWRNKANSVLPCNLTALTQDGDRIFCAAKFTAQPSNDKSSMTCQIKVEGITDVQVTPCVSSPPFNIQYGPKEIRIAPQDTDQTRTLFYIGETINCTSNGNPDPMLTWERFNPDNAQSLGEISEDGILEIKPEWKAGDFQARCIAKNMVNGEEKTDERTIDFKIGTGNKPGTSPVGGASSISGCATLALLIVTIATMMLH